MKTKAESQNPMAPNDWSGLLTVFFGLIRLCTKRTGTSGLVVLCLLFATEWVPGRDVERGSRTPHRESLVFGEIALDKKVSVWGNVWIEVVNIGKKKVVLWDRIHGYGKPFCWHLPPGNYLIWKFGLRADKWVSMHGEFSIETTGQVIYLGRLDVSLEGTKSQTRSESNDVKFSLTDDFDQAAKMFVADHPYVREVPIKQLLVLQKER